ncbi:MAG: C40 family peptidase [Acidimicrobiales bacterium]
MRSTHLGRTSLVSVALALALATLGLWVAPNQSSAVPAGQPAVGNAVFTSFSTSASKAPATIPESGAQITAAAWRMAIGQAVVDAGKTKLGAPYVYAAGGPNAFDCSGFTRWAWMQLGVELPHNSGAQWNIVERISLDQLQPGDLVFDWGFGGGEPDHVSIYVGDGMIIHSPNSRGVVRYDSIDWWTGATTAAGRVR